MPLCFVGVGGTFGVIGRVFQTLLRKPPTLQPKRGFRDPSLLKISSEDNYILISRLVAVSAMLRRQWFERFPGPSGVFPNSFPLGW
jgi:hypothetical protein